MQTTSSPTSTEPSSWSSSPGALAGWLALTALLIAAGFYGQSVDTEEEIVFEYESAIGAGAAYAVLIGLTFLISLALPRSFRDLGFRAFPRRWLWITLGLTVLCLIVSAALEPLLHAGEEQGLAPTEWREDRVGAFAANAVVLTLIGPFGEELFYRGLGVRVLAFLGAPFAIVSTALLFALSHGILSGVPALGFFGVALAWVRFRTRSVWPGVIAHVAYNAIGLLFAVYFAVTEEAVQFASLL